MRLPFLPWKVARLNLAYLRLMEIAEADDMANDDIRVNTVGKSTPEVALEMTHYILGNIESKHGSKTNRKEFLDLFQECYIAALGKRSAKE